MKSIVLTDLGGIWYEINPSAWYKILKKIAPKSLNFLSVFNQELLNKVKKGKISSFHANMLIFKKAGYENFIELEKIFLKEEFKNASKIFVLNKDSKSVLKKLSKKVDIIAVSNMGRSSLELYLILKKIGIANYFKEIYTSYDLGITKPKVFRYFKFLKNMGNVYFLGHSDKEILGAKKYGLKTIGLKNKNADIKIENLKDLLNIFK